MYQDKIPFENLNAVLTVIDKHGNTNEYEKLFMKEMTRIRFFMKNVLFLLR